MHTVKSVCRLHPRPQQQREAQRKDQRAGMRLLPTVQQPNCLLGQGRGIGRPPVSLSHSPWYKPLQQGRSQRLSCLCSNTRPKEYTRACCLTWQRMSGELMWEGAESALAGVGGGPPQGAAPAPAAAQRRGCRAMPPVPWNRRPLQSRKSPCQ